MLGIPAAHRIVEVLGNVDEQGSDTWWGLGRLINTVTTAAKQSPGPLTVGLVLFLVVFVLAVVGAGRRRHIRQPPPLVKRAQGPLPRRPPFQYFEPQRTFQWIIESQSDGRQNEPPD